MRIHFIASLVLVGSIASVAAQTGASPAPATPPPASTTDKKLTLTGCVQAFDSTAQRFTLSDASGTTYRLTGKDVRTFRGIKVRIVGGLVPTPNIAAQAGATDPTSAATATASGQTANLSYIALPELRITTVKRASGACAPTQK